MRPPRFRAAPVALGLDLGSTTIKAGRLDEQGRLFGIESVATPALHGTGRIREGLAEAHLRAARDLLASMARGLPEGTPLGITSQRSSFTLWDRRTGQARTPLISWQDRRAADWCSSHESYEPEVIRRAGLLLSAHYAGPKLATLQQEDPQLRRDLHDGSLRFGTLDTYLTWHESAQRVHETDLTMAARTAMVDLERSDWSPELLRHFEVPTSALPRIVPSGGRAVPLACGLTLTATLADQASGTVAVLDPDGSDVLVNLGTGAFVLRPTRRVERVAGYLTGPILGDPSGRHRYALEGTINGAGPALDRFGAGPTELPVDDPAPEAYAVPDLAGLGSPYWRPDLGLTLSREARKLDTRSQRRIVLEGLLFRVRQILDQVADPTSRVLLAGGLSRDPGVGIGLVALLDRPVARLEQSQSTLLGVTRLAAGLPPFSSPAVAELDPDRTSAGAYLRAKYPRWRRWLAGLLESDLRQPGPIGHNG